jgi:phage head maturation protease
MSFGFSVTKETWDETSSLPLRTIQAVDLIEVSAVARPAYPDTSIAMRSLEGVRQIAKSRNFNAAANRVGMKVSIDMRMRGLMSKA